MESLEKKKFKPTAELQKLGIMFGLGVFMYQMIYGVFSTYISYWLTDILKLPAANMGSIISIGGIFDTVGVVVIGFIVQNVNMKSGKYRFWLKFMPIVFSISYVLIFISWKGSTTFVTVVMAILYVIGGISSSFIMLCARGLEAKSTHTQQGRLFLTGRDGLFITIGRALYGAIFLWFVATIGQGRDSTGYFVWFLIFGILNILAWIFIVAKTKKYDEAVSAEEAKAELTTTKLGFKSTFEALAKNPQFLSFFISETVMDIGVMVSFSTMMYYFTYVVGDIKWMAIYMTSSTITGIIGTYLGPYMCRVFDKKTVFAISQIGYALAFFACFLQVAITGSGTGLFFCIAINIGIIIFNFQNAMKNTLFMDCAEYGYHKNGKETMSFLLSLGNFPFKIAMALGGVIIGGALTAAGYAEGMTATPQLISSLTNISCLLPAICIFVAAIIFIVCYRLTNKKMEVIMADNLAKKKELGIVTEG